MAWVIASWGKPALLLKLSKVLWLWNRCDLALITKYCSYPPIPEPRMHNIPMQAGIHSLQNKPHKGRVVNPCREYQKNRKFIRTSQNKYSSLEWNTNIQDLGKPNISRQVYPKASHNQNLWFERQEKAQDCERNQITQHPPMSPIQKSGQIPYSLGESGLRFS